MLNPNSFRRVIAVACDVTQQLALGAAQTVVAVAGTLSVAARPAAHDQGHEPSGPKPIPAAPSPFAELPAALLWDLAAVEVEAGRVGRSWFESAPFSPWLVPEDRQVPDYVADIDWDGPGVAS